MVVAACFAPLLALPAMANSPGAYEVCLLEAINQSRASIGVGDVVIASDVVPGVRDHSEWMRHHSFQHMTSSARNNILPNGTFTWGENIAMWGDPAAPCAGPQHADELAGTPGEHPPVEL